jgi:hypothetical protein
VQTNYAEVEYQEGDSFLFGPETRGLPQAMLDRFKGITLPMQATSRSLNLSNCVKHGFELHYFKSISLQILQMLLTQYRADAGRFWMNITFIRIHILFTNSHCCCNGLLTVTLKMEYYIMYVGWIN